MHPTTIDEATALLAHHPGAMLLAGGTDAMVEINDGHRRPDASVVAVNRIAALRSWRHDPAAKTLTVGAGVTYTELMHEPLASLAPALAEASRTVGSPQIRNAGTLGGNLGTSSPAGDGLPVLAALDAKLTLASATGGRTMAASDFIVGVKRTAIEPGELITEITLPVVEGWQGYAKVGVRNAMVIAVASVALVVDRHPRAAWPWPSDPSGRRSLRCPDAEDVARIIARLGHSHGARRCARTVSLASVSAASRPITDHRSICRVPPTRRWGLGQTARPASRSIVMNEIFTLHVNGKDARGPRFVARREPARRPPRPPRPHGRQGRMRTGGVRFVQRARRRRTRLLVSRHGSKRRRGRPSRPSKASLPSALQVMCSRHSSTLVRCSAGFARRG